MSDSKHQTRLETVRRIWADVLLLEPEEIEDADNFFELGGDSVKAIQLLGLVSENGIDIDLDTFYQSKTLLSLFNPSKTKRERRG
ncbi:hypothetical protein FJTKL_03200 [Diaporthe vaccinii]|uniref:Carrier domain-containing protein n=1 Tax=Diaporthe vaccinii TaxID=105482 RepID=A0ABR4DWH7_9PEZI